MRRVLSTVRSSCERLTGRADVLPMVFQYDPLQVLVENGPEDHLLFTLNRLQNVSPRIRYDLVDRGRVLRGARGGGGGAGDGLPSPGRLPVLLHWGREEHAVAFYGCKITPEHVQAALMTVPALAAAVRRVRAPGVGGRTRRQTARDRRRAQAGRPDRRRPGDRNRVFRSLADGNQDFRESRRMVPAHLAPTLTLEPAGASRLSGQDVRLKKTYVLR